MEILSFKKAERINSKKEIEDIFKKGTVIFRHPYKLFYLPNNKDFCRIIVSVPKRQFKKAVYRNLIKRRIKESFRLNKNLYLYNQCYDIMIVYISSEILEYKQINDRFKDCLEKLFKINPQTPVASTDTSH